MEELLSPELAEYQKQFAMNRREAAVLCSGLSDAQFNWRPELGRWSIAECLLHLNVGADMFARQIEIATERGRVRGLLGTGPFRYGFLSRWLMGSLEPPVRTRYKTPQQFYPPFGVQHRVPEVLRQFEGAGRRWDECLHRANGLDLARVRYLRQPCLCCGFILAHCSRVRPRTSAAICGRESRSGPLTAFLRPERATGRVATRRRY